MNYSMFKKSEFFEFFNLTEKGSAELDSGLREVHLKTGGFQEHIDLFIYLNKKEEIKKGRLFLDREWIGDINSINPFGTDISKSFIDILFPNSLLPDFKKHLIHYLFNLRGNNQVYIPLHKAFQEFEDAAPETIPFLDVYRGEKKKSTKSTESLILSMENILSEDKARLLIEINLKN
ncbi:MAG: hypothetical protein EU541_01015 [Promethearchaeota archaeon]|nr:MAG: hypothetical protein EU541_01015 [Candidatus Lokiarchaeota archaeon]